MLAVGAAIGILLCLSLRATFRFDIVFRPRAGLLWIEKQVAAAAIPLGHVVQIVASHAAGVAGDRLAVGRDREQAHQRHLT